MTTLSCRVYLCTALCLDRLAGQLLNLSFQMHWKSSQNTKNNVINIEFCQKVQKRPKGPKKSKNDRNDQSDQTENLATEWLWKRPIWSQTTKNGNTEIQFSCQLVSWRKISRWYRVGGYFRPSCRCGRCLKNLLSNSQKNITSRQSRPKVRTNLL